MGALRGIIAPAVTAGVLWLLVGLAHEQVSRLVIAEGLLGQDYGVELLLPATLPRLEWFAPTALQWLPAALGAAALAACTAGLLLLLRGAFARGGSRLARFALAWAVIAASALLVAAVLSIGAVLGRSAFATGSGALLDARSTVNAAALWALLWGWPAALLALRRRGAAARRPALLVAAVAALAGLLLGGSGITARDQRLALSAQAETDRHLRNELHREERERDLEQALDPPAELGEPVPTVAPGDWPVDPLWCTPGQLDFALDGTDAATGHRIAVLRAVNVSDASCVLESYPDLAFGSAIGNLIPVLVDHGGGFLSTDAGVQRLEVAAGASVVTALTWDAMPTEGRETAAWAHIAAYPGAPRAMVELGASDISGGSVQVTAWAPAG